ncbi:MAG: chorismate mutase [Alphaproteobacteria bacterium]|nr:chorismate mutase [Alphaproteobacteria bacterium]
MNTSDPDQNTPPELLRMRQEIDALDKTLIDILARRYNVVRRVGEFKIKHNMEAVQPVRAQAVKDRAVDMGAAQGLDREFTRKLYDLVIDHAHDMEHEILGTTEKGDA